ncbi:MAG: ABC transporter permease [Anaerolineae bacterium]|nr:MAG: ABC transporter permease [Anaerolineae bacterium]
MASDMEKGKRMKRTWQVFKNELIDTLTSPGFWFVTLGMPLLGWLIFGLLARPQKISLAQGLADFAKSHTGGYVDQAGLIREMLPGRSGNLLKPYPNENAAQQALASGEIDGYYLVIPPDYIESGKVTLVWSNLNPLFIVQIVNFMLNVNYNLIEGDPALTPLITGRPDVEEIALSERPSPGLDPENPFPALAPYLIATLYASIIVGPASMFLSSIAAEQQSRLLETLLTSLTPRQLLTGKIIAQGVLGLIMTVTWNGSLYLLVSDERFKQMFDVNLPTEFLFWGVLFYLLGYALYASLLAGVGALAPDLREVSTVAFLIMLPIYLPVFLGSSVLLLAPDGALAVGLSLFPLTAPTAIVVRMSIGHMPVWQMLLAALILALSVVYVVRTAARLFQAQLLLSGQPFSLRRYLKALAGRPETAR